MHLSLVRIFPTPVFKPVTHKKSGNFKNGLIKPMTICRRTDYVPPTPTIEVLLERRKRAVSGLG